MCVAGRGERLRKWWGNLQGGKTVYRGAGWSVVGRGGVSWGVAWGVVRWVGSLWKGVGWVGIRQG